jgi:hypothetical protein
MSSLIKTLFTIGAVLILGGCFLPWRREGDFVSYWTYGIRINPGFKDSGGLLIMALTVIVIILFFRPPDFIRKPYIWGILLSLALVFDSAFHIGKLLLDRANAIGVIGAPSIQIGLVMVSIGSIVLLISSIINYFRWL